MAKPPLVPIKADHIDVALRWFEMSVAELVERSGENQQTVDAIVRGTTSRTRETRRDALAGALGVPSTWLSGEISLARWPLTDAADAGDASDDSDVGAPAQELTWSAPHVPPDRVVLPDLSPAHDLISWDLSRKIVTAWMRDYERGDGGAIVAEGQIVQEKDAPEWLPVRQAIEALLSLRGLRAFFFGRVVGGQGFPVDDVAPDQDLRTELALSQGRALRLTLQPWFDDERSLDYEVWAEVVHWLSLGMPTVVRRKRLARYKENPPFPEEDPRSVGWRGGGTG